ncbi:hypothetical protein ACFFGH_25590 [Lysobacter korlensis]|uniref:Uncharacterized protein n=1 Tax=Lysobacter korlensis TaxID=553636 RepID=A0ABV6RW65_9GAMM
MLHRSSRPPRPSAAHAPAARLKTPVWLVVATIALCAVGPGTSANWSRAAALDSPVITAGAATAELTGFSDLTHVFARNNASQTAYVQLRNTGDVAADLSTAVTLGAGSSQVLTSVVDVTVWNVTSQSQCTRNANPVAPWTGRWTGTPSMTGRLEPGAIVAYCIRTEIERKDLPSTAMSITPSLTATLDVPGTGWRSTATATATQSVAR